MKLKHMIRLKEKEKSLSFEKRVRYSLMIHTVAILLAVVIATLILMNIIENRISDNSAKTGGAVTLLSSEASEKEITQKLMIMTEQKAVDANQSFLLLENIVKILRDEAEQLYAEPSAYGSVKVEPPYMEDDGVLKLQVTYSETVDLTDPATLAEQGLIGNIGPLLYAVSNNNPQVTSCYFASESGIMLQADALQKYQFDENGNVMTFEAKERPWYKNAVERDGLYFTDPIVDAATHGFAVICSAPVYCNGELKGVVGAGMLLTEFQPIVDSAKLSESSIALIVNSEGKLVVTSDERVLQELGNGEDDNLLEDDSEIGGTLLHFLEGDSSAIAKISVSDQEFYISFASLDSIGWNLLCLLPASEADMTTLLLKQELEEQNDSSISAIHGTMVRGMIYLLIGVAITLLLLVFSSRELVKRLLEPIRTLTGKVRAVDGDNLTFTWERNTGDEIDQLGSSFGLLTERIKTYIHDITAITAEKERIGAELSVATRIQADMLPCIFPPYPERKEFDLYASMSPAKEVGGDFYDFFMVDDDHLAMVIGDVSGKGVPAALFMVISKTLIKDHATMLNSPKELLERVNNLLVENNAEDMFVTVWLGILEISTGKITAANAGHEFPALSSGDGKFELFKDKHGLAAGAMEGMRYREYEMQIEKGGCLFVYTDGVPEATDANGNLYETDRMLSALNRDPHADPKTLLDTVRADVDSFVGSAPQFDDLTMLALRYYGKQDESEEK